MAKDRIRIGIIGANRNYGFGVRAHLPALLSLPEYELTAVCTAHRETAEESARHYGAALAFHDYEAMVRHPDVDVVTVCVRVPLHYPMVMAALNAGKHVYCEWPLGANLEEAEEIAKLANSKGVRHMVGLQGRGEPALLHIRELLNDGYVGEVVAANMTMFMPGLLERGRDRAWMADRSKGANTLTIATGHSLDAFCFSVGEFQELAARVATRVDVWETATPGERVPVTSPDNVLISGVLENGAVASVHVATVPSHGSGWRLEVHGKEGTLIASSRLMVQYAQILLRGAKRKESLKELHIPERLSWVPEGAAKGEPFNVAQMYRRFGEAVRDKKPVQPDFNLAVQRHLLLETVQRSSDSKSAQKVSTSGVRELT